MSNTIDRKVVEMQFDNAQFERNVRSSMSTLEKLKSSLKFDGISKGFDEVDRSAKKLNFSSLSDGLTTVTNKFSAFEAIALGALMRIGSAAVDAGAKLVKSLTIDNVAAGWSKFEQKTQSVGTLIAQGYDMSTVEEQLARLNWFTDETSYSFTEMVSSIAKFTASGQSLPRSVDALMGIANWAALSGQNAATASRAMYQLSQAMGSGIMRKEDYKSIQNVSMDTVEFRQAALDAGVALGTLQKNADGTYRSLIDGAKSSDFTINQFADHLTQDAWFTSDVMMKVFEKYNSAVADIYEYAEENGITASQAIEELSGELDEFGLKAFKASQEARSWTDTVESVKEAVASGFMKTFEIIFGNYEEATKLWTDLANKLYDVFAEPLNSFNEVLEEGLKSKDVFINDYLKEILGGEDMAMDKILEVAADYGIFSDEAKKLALELTGGNQAMADALTHFTNLNWEAEVSSDALIDYATSVTGATREEIADLKALGDEFGYQSDQFIGELDKVFGEGSSAAKELAKDLLGISKGEDSITSRNIDVYLRKTFNLTREQSKELTKLATEYGANSEEVRKYIDSLKDLENSGFGDIEGAKQAMTGLLELTTRNTGAVKEYKKSDIVGYVSELTGATSDQVEKLYELVNAETDSAEAAAANAAEIEKLIEAISGGDEELGNMILSLMKLQKETDGLTGRAKLIEAFNNVWEYLGDILGEVKEAFRDVFPAKTAEDIYNIASKIQDFTSKLKLSEENAAKLRRAFDGLFTIFKLVGQVAKAAFIPIKDLFNRFKSAQGDILNTIAGWGDWIVELEKSGKVAEKATAIFTKVSEVVQSLLDTFLKLANIKSIQTIFGESGGGFAGVLLVISDRIQTVIEGVADLVSILFGVDVTGFKEKVSSAFKSINDWLKNVLPNSEKLKSAWDKITTAFNNAKTAIKNFFKTKDDVSEFEKSSSRLSTVIQKIKDGLHNFAEGVKSFFSKVKEAFQQSKIGQALSNIWDKVKTIAANIGEKLGDLFSKIGDSFKNAKIEDIIAFFDKLTKFVVDILGGVLTLKLIDFVEGVKEMPEALKTVVEGFGYVIQAFADIGDAIRQNIQIKSVKEFGTALLIVAAALAIMAMIPTDKLMVSSAALVAIGYALVDFCKQLNDSTILNAKTSSKNASAILKLSAAILIIAAAISMLKGMDVGSIIAATVAIAIIMEELQKVAKTLGDTKINAKNVKKSATGLVIFAAAVGLVVLSVKALGNMETGALIQGMIGVSLLIAEMTAVAVVLSKFGSGSKVAGSAAGLILFAASLLLVVASVAILAGMDPASLQGSMAAVSVLITELTLVVGVLSKFGDGGKVAGSSAGLVLFAAALIVVVSSVKILSTINPESLIPSVIAVSALIVELTAAAAVMSKFGSGSKVVGSSAGLILFAGSLLLVIVGVKELAKLEPSSLISSMVAVSILLGELVAASAIMSKFSDAKSLAGAAGILVMAIALDALIPAVKAIGAMQWGEIIKALVAFAAVLGIMVAAGFGLKYVATYLLEGAAAMALFGVGITLVGAGLILIGNGLTALSIGITAFAAAFVASSDAIMFSLKTILLGVAELIPEFVKRFAEGIVQLLNVITENEDAITNAFVALLRSALKAVTMVSTEFVETIFNLIIGVLDILVEKTPEVVDKVFTFVIEILNGIAARLPELIAAGAHIIESLIEGIIAAMKEFKIENVDDLGAAVENLLGVMLMLGAMSVVFPFAFAGVLALGTIAVELAGVLAILGGLSKIPGITDFIASGGQLLETIGTALGQFLGGIAGGAASAFSAQLPGIGENLTAFMDSISGFADGCRSMNGSVLDGAANLAGAILSLMGVELLDNIAGFFGLGVDWGEFGDKLTQLGEAMISFSEVTADLDPASFTPIVSAIDQLVTLSQKLPNTEGLWGWLSGKQDFGEFGATLVSLSEGIIAFGDAASGVTPETAEAMIRVANALGPLVELSHQLPNTEGLWGWVSGHQDLGEFGDTLVKLATGIIAFGGAASGVTAETAEAMVRVANALGPLVELSNQLPNTEGLWGWVSGHQDLGEFGDTLVKLATGITSFATAAAMIPPTVVASMMMVTTALVPLIDLSNQLPNTEGLWGWINGHQDLGEFGDTLSDLADGVSKFAEKAMTIPPYASSAILLLVPAIDALIDLANKLPNTGGLFDWLSGQQDLGDFGDKLSDFAGGIKKMSEKLANVDFSKISQVAPAVQDLVKLSGGDIDGGKLKSFGSDLKDFADNVKDFTSKWEKVKMDKLEKAAGEIEKVAALGERFASINTAAISGLANALKTMADTSIESFTSAFDGASGKAETAVSKLISAATKAVDSGAKDIKSALQKAVDDAAGSIKSSKDKYKALGKDLITKIKEGIDEKKNSGVVDKALSKLSDGGISVLRGKYQLFYSAGAYLVDGFISGINSKKDSAKRAASSLGTETHLSLKQSVEENSPSKITEGYGEFFGQGFVNGIISFITVAEDSAASVGKSALEGLYESINNASDIGLDNGDLTIRPVMDLSEIQNGVNKMDSMLGGYDGYALSGSFGYASSAYSSMMSRRSNSDGSEDMTRLADSFDKLAGRAPVTQNNTFNIQGDDPEAIAGAVADILTRQIDREEKLWD